MSLNCSPDLLPHERFIYQNKDIRLKLTNRVDTTTINTSGQLFLSNQRILVTSGSKTYRVQSKGDREFRSLSAPIVRQDDGGIQTSRLIQPWLGPNKWEAVLYPSKHGQFEPDCEWTLTITFTSGGVFDFVEKFANAVSDLVNARENGIVEPLPPYAT